MESVNEFLQSVQMGFVGSNLLMAVLLLVIAFVLSSVVKKIFIKILKKMDTPKILEKIGVKEAAQQENVIKLLGSIVYFLVFLVFLPGVFSRLGVESVTRPIEDMLSQFLTYIPNVIAAIIVMVIGYVIAKLVREIVKSILEGFKLDNLQEKLGVKSEDASKFSTVIAYVVYLLIFIPAVIAALDILNIDSISKPTQEMLNSILYIIPLVVIAVVIIVIGVAIAKITSRVLYTVLSSIGVNNLLKNISIVDETAFKEFDLARIISEIVKIVITLITMVQGVSILNLEVVTGFGTALIKFLPQLLSATLLLIAGYILAVFVEGALKKAGHLVLATVFKVIIFALLAFVVLGQLGVELFILNATYIVILIATAVTATLAFGLGGKDFAKKVLDKVNLDGLDKKK